MISAGTPETPCRTRVIHLKVLKSVRFNNQQTCPYFFMLINEADCEGELKNKQKNRSGRLGDLQEQFTRTRMYWEFCSTRKIYRHPGIPRWMT